VSGGVRLDIGDAALRHHLRRLVALDAGKYTGVRREIGEYMVGDVQDSILGQRLFTGAAMPPSAASKGGQVMRKIKTGKRAGKLRKVIVKPHLTLQLEGHLRNSYVPQMTPGGVLIGSNSDYAAIHHFGGLAGRGKKTRILARPVLGVGVRQELQIGYLIDDMLRALQ
jgi:phage gpG-like protein